MRLVPDTNIVASGLLGNGNPRRLMQLARTGRISLYTSTFLPSFVSVVKRFPVPRIAPDPDDDVVLGTALAAKADVVVTGDHALLSVGQYEGVRIVSASQALDILNSI